MAEISEKTPRKRGGPGRPFEPGRSPNPGGRPKKTEEMRRIEDAARQYSQEALDALVDEARTGKGAPRVAAATALLDRGWGKAIERREEGDPGSFALSVEEIDREIIEKNVKLGYVKAQKKA